MSKLKSFSIGLHGENLVKQIFVSHGYGCWNNNEQAKLKDYDLIVVRDDFEKTVEVKLDAKSFFTGNIAIEFYNSVKCETSGIDATKADFWAHVVQEQDGYKVFITTVESLKYYLNTYKPFKMLADVGDGNACIYLYKKEDILPVAFYNITDLTTKEFDELIHEL